MSICDKDLRTIKMTTAIQYLVYGIILISYIIFYGHKNGYWWQTCMVSVAISVVVTLLAFFTYLRAWQRLQIYYNKISLIAD